MISAIAAGLIASVSGPVSGQELGANDFLISGDFLLGTTFDSAFPDVAYNPVSDNYLVVWEETYRHLGCDEGVVTSEIHMRLLDGAAPAPVGGFQTPVSSMGDTCDDFGAREPAVAYNSTDNEYFVVWTGSDDADGGLVDEFEIFGQRLAGATGFATGIRSRRITEVGGIGAAAPDATRPALAYNATENEFLLVYMNGAGIEARVLDPAGATLAGPFVLSPGATYGLDPAVAWSSVHNEYLVVWTLFDGSSPGTAIVALHLDDDGAATSPVYPVTDPGELPSLQLPHTLPDLAYDPSNDQFLWSGRASARAAGSPPSRARSSCSA